MPSISQINGGVALGECVFMRDQPEPKLVLNGQTFLKSGSILVAEEEAYPDAFSQFKTVLPARPYNWLQKSSSSFGFSPTDIRYCNGVWLAQNVNNNPVKVYYSTDLINWTEAPTIPMQYLWGIEVINNLFVLNTNLMDQTTYPGCSIITSPDGITWTRRTLPSGGIYRPNMCHTGTHIVCVAPSYNFNYGGVMHTTNIIYSSDGINWSGTTNSSMTSDTLGVSGANGVLVWAGYTNTTMDARTGVAPFSTMTARASLISGLTLYYSFWCMAYINGLYVGLTRNGKILTSPDLNTWTVVFNNSAYIFSDCRVVNNEIIVAAGPYIVTSVDGSNWVVRDTLSSGSYVAIAVKDPQNIAVVGGGILAIPLIQNYVGVRTYTERGGSPLYMRIK